MLTDALVQIAMITAVIFAAGVFLMSMLLLHLIYLPVLQR